MHSEKITHSIGNLPEGSMPTFVLELLGYIDTNGKQQLLYRTGGDVPMYTMIGALETIQQVVVHQVLGSQG